MQVRQKQEKGEGKTEWETAEQEKENEVGVAELDTSMFSRMDSNDLESLTS